MEAESSSCIKYLLTLIRTQCTIKSLSRRWHAFGYVPPLPALPPPRFYPKVLRENWKNQMRLETQESSIVHEEAVELEYLWWKIGTRGPARHENWSVDSSRERRRPDARIFWNVWTLDIKTRDMAFFKKRSRPNLHFRANSILFSSGGNKHSCLPYVSFKIFAFQSLLSFEFQSCSKHGTWAFPRWAVFTPEIHTTPPGWHPTGQEAPQGP